MLVTRVMGTKIRRRPKTSATSPSTLGWLASERIATTRSRTLPTWSPWGSKIGRPTMRAAYTRDGAVLTRPRYRWEPPRRGNGAGGRTVNNSTDRPRPGYPSIAEIRRAGPISGGREQVPGGARVEARDAAFQATGPPQGGRHRGA